MPEAKPEADSRASGLVINRISAHRDPRRVTLEIGERDIRIRRTILRACSSRKGGGIRTNIKGFSMASKRRLLFAARNFSEGRYMITTTYPADFPTDGRLVKNHLRRFRQWLLRNGVRAGLWVLEFQARGAPHFHIFVTDWVDKDALADIWYRIVGSNDPKHLRAGCRIELFRNNAAKGGYVMKYAAKMEQKDVPMQYDNVGRFWGIFGNANISKSVSLPLHKVKDLVRTIRRAHIKQRQQWVYRRKFRDNGVSGFIAWDAAYIVRRATDPLLAGPS
tara:strand:- start:2941 stop:3771 length:831 start_codon:yes stop_codon:yes gene_type:complete